MMAFPNRTMSLTARFCFWHKTNWVDEAQILSLVGSEDLATSDNQ